jgi:hypothetical protein
VTGDRRELRNDASSHIHSFIHQWLCSHLVGPGRFFSFVILYTAGSTPWTGEQPVASPLPTYNTNTE